MAVMEIAAAAKSDDNLRQTAFKRKSPSAKAVVEQLLEEITSENGEPEIQVPCCKAIGSLAQIFPAPAKLPIKALTSVLANHNQVVLEVATEAASALSKFASDENYLSLEHSKYIIAEGAVEHLVLLALNSGYPEAQLSAIELLCHLSLNGPDSEALAKANIIHVLKSTCLDNRLSHLFAENEIMPWSVGRPSNPFAHLVNNAVAKLEFSQLRCSSLSIDIDPRVRTAEENASLLRLLKYGGISGQEAAATALGHLAWDKERVRQLRKEGASSVFTHILGKYHSTSMKVQLQVTRLVAKFASLDEGAQRELACKGAIRLLVTLLKEQTNTVEGLEGPMASTAAIVVRSNPTQLTSSTGVMGNITHAHDHSGPTSSDARLQPVAMAVTSVMDQIRSSALPAISENLNSGRMVPLRQGSRAHRDLEDPEVKLGLKVEAAHALWKLAAGHRENCKLTTDTCALLCFAKLMKHGDGELKYNSVMAVMEIAAAAESDLELRQAAFKRKSPSAKAVVEQLLEEITRENGEPEIQVSCCKAIGSLAQIFSSQAKLPIRALTSALAKQNQDLIQVATAAASALSKFASDKNFLHLEQSQNIIAEGAVEHLVQLALNFGYPESQLSAVELLCYLSLNVPNSEALARTFIIHVLRFFFHDNQLSQLFLEHETARPLINDAIAKLEIYHIPVCSSSVSIDMGPCIRKAEENADWASSLRLRKECTNSGEEAKKNV